MLNSVDLVVFNPLDKGHIFFGHKSTISDTHAIGQTLLILRATRIVIYSLYQLIMFFTLLCGYKKKTIG